MQWFYSKKNQPDHKRQTVNHSNRISTGFSLVELMIATTISLLILSAVLAFYSRSIRDVSQLNIRMQMTQQLAAMLQIMQDDVRRAGYWSTAHLAGSPAFQLIPNENTDPPFFLPLDVKINAARSCISYSYDKQPLSADTGSEDLHAFRLKNGQIQSLQQAKLAAFKADPCANAAGTWMSINDAEYLKITHLLFDYAALQCIDENGNFQSGNAADVACQGLMDQTGKRILARRKIKIRVEAESVSDDKLKLEMSRIVRINNDIVLEIP